MRERKRRLREQHDKRKSIMLGGEELRERKSRRKVKQKLRGRESRGRKAEKGISKRREISDRNIKQRRRKIKQRRRLKIIQTAHNDLSK